MTIPTIEAGMDRIGTALTRQWIETSNEDLEGMTPDQVIHTVGVHRVIELLVSMLDIEPDKPLNELQGRSVSDACGEVEGRIELFEKLLDRLSIELSRMWFDRPLDCFQGRTPNEVLEFENGEVEVLQVIERLEKGQRSDLP